MKIKDLLEDAIINNLFITIKPTGEKSQKYDSCDIPDIISKYGEREITHTLIGREKRGQIIQDLLEIHTT